MVGNFNNFLAVLLLEGNVPVINKDCIIELMTASCIVESFHQCLVLKPPFL